MILKSTQDTLSGTTAATSVIAVTERARIVGVGIAAGMIAGGFVGQASVIVSTNSLQNAGDTSGDYPILAQVRLSVGANAQAFGNIFVLMPGIVLASYFVYVHMVQAGASTQLDAGVYLYILE